VLQKTDPLVYFEDNFGKYGPILTIFSLLLWNLGKAIKNPAYRIPQTVISGCLDISAHARHLREK